jgi:hypothetical protein
LVHSVAGNSLSPKMILSAAQLVNYTVTHAANQMLKIIAFINYASELNV